MPSPPSASSLEVFARGVVAVVLLVFLAAPFWPGELDDVYITLAYAHEWLEHGVLRWSSGEVVEGYSHFLFLCLLTAAGALGIDGMLAAKLLSLLSAFCILGLLSARLPRGYAGTVALLATAAWAPLGWWSVMGMETTLFALQLAVGWPLLVGRKPTLGVLVLALASLTRPEGIAYVVLGALVALARRRTTRDLAGVGGVFALLAAYHLIRTLHFDAWLPTPVVVKVQAVSMSAIGWGQLARELPTAAGVLIATLTAVRLSRNAAVFAMTPLLIQVAVLVRADGDWMAWARLLLPGVIAFVSTAAALGSPRSAPGWLLAIATAAAASFATLAPTDPLLGAATVRGFSVLLPPFEGYRAPLTPPLQADVAWVVSNVPDGDAVLASDVGLLGHIDGVAVRDIVGLVDREIAEQHARRVDEDDRAAEAFWRERYGEGPGRIAFVRIVHWYGGAPAPLPDWMRDRLPVRDELRDGRMRAHWYRAHERLPSRERIRARWTTLAERFPAHPWFAWRALLAEADITGVPPTGEGDGPLADLPSAGSFADGSVPLKWEPGKGFALPFNGHLVSIPLRGGGGATLELTATDPGAEGARARIASEPACGTGTEVSVGETAVTISVDELLCPEGGRLRVEFVNDDAGEGWDRNLFVKVDWPTGGPSGG